MWYLNLEKVKYRPICKKKTSLKINFLHFNFTSPLMWKKIDRYVKILVKMFTFSEYLFNVK